MLFLAPFFRRHFALTGVATLMMACAVGSEADDVYDPAPAINSTDAGGSPADEAPSPATKDAGPAPRVDAGSVSKVDAAPSDSSGKADSGPADSGSNSCVALTTCSTSTDLGTMSGDTGNDTHTATGTTSAWFHVRMGENEHGALGRAMSLRAELVSPPGSNFDLYLYFNPGADALECAGTIVPSTNPAGQLDTTSLKFGETGPFSNAADDGRTVAIEVRDVSGTCNATSSWTLALTGN